MSSYILSGATLAVVVLTLFVLWSLLSKIAGTLDLIAMRLAKLDGRFDQITEPIQASEVALKRLIFETCKLTRDIDEIDAFKRENPPRY